MHHQRSRHDHRPREEVRSYVVKWVTWLYSRATLAAFVLASLCVGFLLIVVGLCGGHIHILAIIFGYGLFSLSRWSLHRDLSRATLNRKL